MIKIVNTICFVFLLLSFLEKTISAEGTDLPHEQDILKRTSTPEYRTNNQSHIISPTPIRYIATLPTIQEVREDPVAKEEELKSIKTHNEQIFRLHAYHRMSGADQQLLISREYAYIYTFNITNTKVHLNDGFYQKVDLFDIYRRPISSDVIQSLMFPLTVMEQRTFPDWYGNSQTCYVPQFKGYVYRKRNGFWLWTDLPEVPQ